MAIKSNNNNRLTTVVSTGLAVPPVLQIKVSASRREGAAAGFDGLAADEVSLGCFHQLVPSTSFLFISAHIKALWYTYPSCYMVH